MQPCHPRPPLLPSCALGHPHPDVQLHPEYLIGLVERHLPAEAGALYSRLLKCSLHQPQPLGSKGEMSPALPFWTDLLDVHPWLLAQVMGEQKQLVLSMEDGDRFVGTCVCIRPSLKQA